MASHPTCTRCWNINGQSSSLITIWGNISAWINTFSQWYRLAGMTSAPGLTSMLETTPDQRHFLKYLAFAVVTGLPTWMHYDMLLGSATNASCFTAMFYYLVYGIAIYKKSRNVTPQLYIGIIVRHPEDIWSAILHNVTTYQPASTRLPVTLVVNVFLRHAVFN